MLGKEVRRGALVAEQPGVLVRGGDELRAEEALPCLGMRVRLQRDRRRCRSAQLSQYSIRDLAHTWRARSQALGHGALDEGLDVVLQGTTAALTRGETSDANHPALCSIVIVQPLHDRRRKDTTCPFHHEGEATARPHDNAHVVPGRIREELGYVGIPNKIAKTILQDIVKQKKIPIISPLGLGKNNQTYNINGDTAAGAIAKSLKSRRLLLMTNVEGVLDKQKKLIEEISSSEIIEMIKNETITEGMIPKINTCLDAVNNGVTAVGIIDGRKQHSILFEIFSDKGSGTLIRK